MTFASAGLAFLLAWAPAQAGEETFRVYFKANSAELTREAKEVVAQRTTAVEIASEIFIAGYADAQEDDPDAVARARAAAVFEAIAGHVPGSAAVRVVGRGDDYQPVPSEPGKSKPENRFVEIEIR